MERSKDNISVVSYRIKSRKLSSHGSLRTPFGAPSSRNCTYQMMIAYIWVENTCVQDSIILDVRITSIRVSLFAVALVGPLTRLFRL